MRRGDIRYLTVGRSRLAPVLIVSHAEGGLNPSVLPVVTTPHEVNAYTVRLPAGWVVVHEIQTVPRRAFAGDRPLLSYAPDSDEMRAVDVALRDWLALAG